MFDKKSVLDHVEQFFIHIFSAQVIISMAGNYVDLAAAECDDRAVKGPFTKISDHEYPIPLLFSETIGQSSSGWFINQRQNFDPCRASRVNDTLALLFIEIRWYTDHRFAASPFVPRILDGRVSLVLQNL